MALLPTTTTTIVDVAAKQAVAPPKSVTYVTPVVTGGRAKGEGGSSSPPPPPVVIIEGPSTTTAGGVTTYGGVGAGAKTDVQLLKERNVVISTIQQEAAARGVDVSTPVRFSGFINTLIKEGGITPSLVSSVSSIEDQAVQANIIQQYVPGSTVKTLAGLPDIQQKFIAQESARRAEAGMIPNYLVKPSSLEFNKLTDMEQMFIAQESARRAEAAKTAAAIITPKTEAVVVTPVSNSLGFLSSKPTGIIWMGKTLSGAPAIDILNNINWSKQPTGIKWMGKLIGTDHPIISKTITAGEEAFNDILAVPGTAAQMIAPWETPMTTGEKSSLDTQGSFKVKDVSFMDLVFGKRSSILNFSGVQLTAEILSGIPKAVNPVSQYKIYKNLQQYYRDIPETTAVSKKLDTLNAAYNAGKISYDTYQTQYNFYASSKAFKNVTQNPRTTMYQDIAASAVPQKQQDVLVAELGALDFFTYWNPGTRIIRAAGQVAGGIQEVEIGKYTEGLVNVGMGAFIGYTGVKEFMPANAGKGSQLFSSLNPFQDITFSPRVTKLLGGGFKYVVPGVFSTMYGINIAKETGSVELGVAAGIGSYGGIVLPEIFVNMGKVTPKIETPKTEEELTTERIWRPGIKENVLKADDSGIDIVVPPPKGNDGDGSGGGSGGSGGSGIDSSIVKVNDFKTLDIPKSPQTISLGAKEELIVSMGDNQLVAGFPPGGRPLKTSELYFEIEPIIAGEVKRGRRMDFSEPGIGLTAEEMFQGKLRLYEGIEIQPDFGLTASEMFRGKLKEPKLNEGIETQPTFGLTPEEMFQGKFRSFKEPGIQPDFGLTAEEMFRGKIKEPKPGWGIVENIGLTPEEMFRGTIKEPRTHWGIVENIGLTEGEMFRGKPKTFGEPKIQSSDLTPEEMFRGPDRGIPYDETSLTRPLSIEEIKKTAGRARIGRPSLYLRDLKTGKYVMGPTEKGEILTPGGKAEPGETIKQALLREVGEEILIRDKRSSTKYRPLTSKDLSPIKFQREVVYPEEVQQVFTADIEDASLLKAGKSDIKKIVLVSPRQARTFFGNEITGGTAKNPTGTKGIRYQELGVINYLERGAEPTWLYINVDFKGETRKLYLGSHSRYDVLSEISMNRLKSNNEMFLTSGAASPLEEGGPGSGGTKLIQKGASQVSISTAPKIWVHTPSSLKGDIGYLGLSYTNEGSGESRISFGTPKKSVVYLFEEPPSSVMPTSKTIHGSEAELTIAGVLKTTERPTEARIGRKNVSIQPAEVVKDVKLQKEVAKLWDEKIPLAEREKIIGRLQKETGVDYSQTDFVPKELKYEGGERVTYLEKPKVSLSLEKGKPIESSFKIPKESMKSSREIFKEFTRPLKESFKEPFSEPFKEERSFVYKEKYPSSPSPFSEKTPYYEEPKKTKKPPYAYPFYGGGLSGKREKAFGAAKQVPTYTVLIRKKRQYIPFATGLPREQALRVGSEKALRDIARTFKVVPTGKTTEMFGEFETPFLPEPTKFRAYQVRRGKQIPLTDTFIQRESANLQSITEKQQLADAKRIARLLGGGIEGTKGGKVSYKKEKKKNIFNDKNLMKGVLN